MLIFKKNHKRNKTASLVFLSSFRSMLSHGKTLVKERENWASHFIVFCHVIAACF